MTNTLKIQSLTMLLLPVITVGCASVDKVSNNTKPTLPLPEQWQALPANVSADTRWIDALGDANLQALIKEALGSNFSLRASEARVRAALGSARIAGADGRPTLSASLDSRRSKQTSAGIETIGNQFSLGLQSSWELDLWQRLGHRSRAASATADASIADWHAAQLSLSANIAKSWFAFIESQQQTDLSQRRVDNFSATLDVINDRYLAGIGSALDVQLARENRASAQSTLLNQQLLRASNRRTLETLLGRYPAGAIESTGGLEASIPRIPNSQPLTLLERRPDLRAAKARVIAASENNIDVSRNFLPSLNLTVSGGNSSDEFSQLLDWDQLFWNLAAGLTQPIFQGGRLAAQRDIATAQWEESLANYTQTALTAFNEVETALASEPLLNQQMQAQSVAAQEARRAAELALERYQAGITTIVTLLESQRRAFNAESSLLSVKRSLILNRIDLHLALGGSFSSDEKQK